MTPSDQWRRYDSASLSNYRYILRQSDVTLMTQRQIIIMYLCRLKASCPLPIHCIYVSVIKPTCPAFSAWLNTGSFRSLKVTGKAIMLCSIALPSKLCAALHGQSNVGSICDCKPCRSLDLSVLVEILSGVDNDHGTGPRRYGSVNSRSTFCPMTLL